MMIPILMKQLNKANPSFNETSCQKAIGSKTSRLLHIFPIQIQHMLRLVRKVVNLRNRRLQTISHFILSNSFFDARVQSTGLLISI